MDSYKSIVAVAVMLFASAMMGIGVHHLLDSGTCSTTGFTRYGPAPPCTSSSVAWGIVMPVGLFVVIAAGAVGAPNLFVLLGPLFLMFGLGALTVGSGTGSSGPPPAFALIFGGCFAAAGAGLLAVPLWSALSSSGARAPSQGRQQATEGEHRAAHGKHRTGGKGSTALAPEAIASWVAALAIAVGVSSLFPADHPATGAHRTDRADAFFQPATLGSTDPSSLYRTGNFKRALTIARAYLGAGAKVRSLLLVPGGMDLSVALGPRGLRGKDISVDATGGYLSSDVVALTGSVRTYALSTLDPSIPAALASRLAAAGKLSGRQIDHMLAN